MSHKQPTPAPDPAMRPAPPAGPPSVALPLSSVVWHPTADDPPDDDLVVLMAAADGEVWPGFKLGGQWFDIEATPQPAPRFWAHFPSPPQ